MKTLLAVLLLTVAPPLDAQDKIALTKVIWAPTSQDFSRAVYEDGDCAKIEAGKDNLLWYISYELPIKYPAPDSVTFVLSHNCEFTVFSEWSRGNQKILQTVPGAGAGSFTFQYGFHRYPFAVGVSVSGMNSQGPQTGVVCLDAAYAWYSTATVDTTERLINVQRVQWYDVAGAPNFYGTRKELQKSGLKGMFFSVNGKYHILE